MQRARIRQIRCAALALALILVLALVLALVLRRGPVPAVATHRGVVIQVSTANPASWDMTLNNIGFIQSQLSGTPLPLEVVAFGPGVDMLKRDSVVHAGLRSAMREGVRFVACESSMHTRELKRADMYPGVNFVPLGVAEIVRKQREGWFYLKP